MNAAGNCLPPPVRSHLIIQRKLKNKQTPCHSMVVLDSVRRLLRYIASLMFRKCVEPFGINTYMRRTIADFVLFVLPCYRGFEYVVIFHRTLMSEVTNSSNPSTKPNKIPRLSSRYFIGAG